jgi:hypothetical protein
MSLQTVVITEEVVHLIEVMLTDLLEEKKQKYSAIYCLGRMIRLTVSIKQASLQFEPSLSLSMLSSLLKRPSVVQFHATFRLYLQGSRTWKHNVPERVGTSPED